jgi:pimeloyl-ACP methyl ester carboxylesterase
MRSIKLFIFILAISALCPGQKPADKWAKFDGGRIHYYDIGQRKNTKAIVFIHGWTCNADFWKDSLNAFPKYRVIALDLVGHGQSDKPKTNYSMEYLARSVEAVMNDAGVKKVVLVGHSMGTPVARQFYRIFPDQTIGIVIVDGALRPFAAKKDVEKFNEPLKTNFKDNAPKMIDGLLQPMKDDELKKFVRDGMLSAPEHVAVSEMDGMIDESIWGSDKINVPVLAILAASPWWPKDTKDFDNSIASNLEFQMWNGVSHFLFMEKPKEFNETVLSFIQKNKLL